MDAVKMNFALTKEQQKLKDETYQALLTNAHVQNWLKKYDLPESFVYDHTGKFSDWIKSKEKCDGCQGLDFCRQSIKGQFMDLYMDGFLNFGIHRCDYFRAFENELVHGKYYVDTTMAPEQLRIDIKKIDIRKESKEYKANVLHILDRIENEQVEKGLYLYGKPGVGKSYLAAGITNFYARKKIRCAFINVPKLMSDLKMMFHDRDAMDAKLTALRKVAILVLDDIGGESVTAWSRDDVLLPLLDARMEDKKVTFFTSNYSMKELEDRLTMTSNKMSEPVAAMRLLERIRTLSSEEFVKGESRRK